MNDQEFDRVVADLARGELLDVETRQQALAYARRNPAAEAKLGAHRKLSGHLRELAQSLEAEEAPAQVEDALRKAFRENRAAPPAKRVHPSWVRAGQVAVLSAAAIGALFLLTVGPSLENGRDAEDSQGPVATAIPGRPIEDQPGPTGRFPLDPRPQGADPSRREPIVDAGSNTQPEIATDFLPIFLGEPLNTSEPGHLVRVTLPRSALTYFGLQAGDGYATTSRIPADVFVGEDGTARAVRFIRTRSRKSGRF